MKAIALRFRREMDQCGKLLRLVSACRSFSNSDMARFRSRHSSAPAIRDLHLASVEFTSTPLAYDGIYLAICGQFEFAVRELIERFVELISADIATHGHLPEELRNWHPKGAADIILRVNEDRFQHLTITTLVQNLVSCAGSGSQPYKLTGEAFSYNDHNLRAAEIDGILTKRIGLKKVWQKLARNAALAVWAGSSNPSTVENRLRSTLDTIIGRRNSIIHRGRRYYTPGSSEVLDCAEFLGCLVDGLEEVLSNYKGAL